MPAKPADLSHIVEGLRGFAVETSALALDPTNVRKHSRRNLDAIKASLVKFGQFLPIVVQKEGMIVRAGNGRLTAARELGWKHIAAVVVDKDNVEAVEMAIADNRTAELAEWDWEGLSVQLREIADRGDTESLLALGWSEHELTPLLKADWAPAAVDEGATFEAGGAREPAGGKEEPVQPRIVTFNPEQWERIKVSLGELPAEDLAEELTRGAEVFADARQA